MAAHSADVVLYWEFEARGKSREATAFLLFIARQRKLKDGLDSTCVCSLIKGNKEELGVKPAVLASFKLS